MGFLKRWRLRAPDKGVHGIGLVPESNGLLVACASKLVLFDRSSGKVTATRQPPGREWTKWLTDLHIAYCAGRQGNISVVAVEVGKLTTLGDVPDETGTGDVRFDPKTHTVWIAYKKGSECFVSRLHCQMN